MASFADRCKDTTSSTGTGALTLDNTPPLGYRSFSTLDSQGFYYCITSEAGDWEVGYGTVSGTTLTRNSGDFAVLASSAGGTSAVNFGAGSKDVFCCAAAQFFSQQPVIKVSTSNPVDFAAGWNNKKYQGFQADTLGFAVEFLTTGQYKLTAYRVDSFDGSGNAQWVEVAFAGWKYDSSPASYDLIKPAFSTTASIDLTGLNKLSGKNMVAAGDSAYPFQTKSLSVGFGLAGAETGYGSHQSDIAGDSVYTTNATGAEMNLALQVNGCAIFRIHVVAYSDGGDHKAWTCDAVVTRAASGTGSVLKSGTLTELSASAGAASWTASLTDGTTNSSTSIANGLLIEVAGAAATNIHWTTGAFITYAHKSVL